MVHFPLKLGEKWHEKRKSNRELKKQVMKKHFTVQNEFLCHK
jgi:hypothetical protein